jgi:nitric oxide reductase subunit C
MLSKTQAKLFFLTATLGFSGVFLWLTVDTIRQVPARSNEDQMDAAVVRGKEIWETNNCMGCHTLLGEGAYYAPELTKVVDRRGETWLKLFLADPQAMYPGRRKMVQYNFTPAEIDDVVAFLGWIGKIDTNGFPQKPDLGHLVPGVANAASTATVVASASVGAAGAVAAPAKGGAPPAIFTSICQSCHALGGIGGAVGPALDTVGDRYSADTMRAWLQDPQSVKPGTAMPDLGLSDADLTSLTSFLMAQSAAEAP